MLVPDPETVERPQPLLLFGGGDGHSEVVHRFLGGIPFTVILLRSRLPRKPHAQKISSYFIPDRQYQTDVFHLYLLFWGDGIYVVHPSVELHDCFAADCHIFVFGFPVACYMAFCPLRQFGDSFQAFHSTGGLDDKLYGTAQHVVVP